jgi:orotate phosphoribosyltransferase
MMTPKEAVSWLAHQPSQLGQGAEKRALDMLKAFSHREGEFTLASGAKSDFYIDCRQTLLLPEGRRACAAAMRMAIHSTKGWPSKYVPAGSGMGGSLLASHMGFESTCSGHIHVRKEAKDHGTQRIERAPDIEDGATVIVFDDVATSGGSAQDVALCLMEAGFEVAGVAVLVDRGEGAGAKLATTGLPLLSLFTRADFQ